ncbi:MAG: hypothetical protein EYC70_16520 [Planctomycetota bacterium]|nr:MAG: hypothetical protein EYC70_16520 [Planctomycetota bacterium]
MLLPLPLAASFLCVSTSLESLAAPAPAAQGGTFTTGQNIELPAQTSSDADHATLAINSSGDVFVAWSSRRPDLGDGALQVEGAYMYYRGAGLWDLPVAGVTQIILGAADAHVFTSGVEGCRKPDVLAAGGDFFVVWPRASSDRLLQRVEGVRIVPDRVGGFFVDREAPGVGFPLDPLVDGLSAGIMPDLVEIPGYPLGVAVVYADDEIQEAPHREYDLRYLRADFSVVPPLIDGPYVLEDDFPFDDPPIGGEPVGGKILPDAVRDDSGNLVLAYEHYVRTGHQGATLNEGRVFVNWYADPGSTQPLKLASAAFQGASAGNLVRRPNLATSRMDASDSISLAFAYAADGSALADVGYHELTWDGVGIQSTDLGYPNLSSSSDTMPAPAHGINLRLCFADRGSLSSPKLMSFLKSINGRLLQVGTVARPWRPAVEVMEPAPAGSGASLYVPLTYEAPSVSGPLRVFLSITRL